MTTNFPIVGETFEETSAVNRIVKAIEEGGYTPTSHEEILADCRQWASYGDGGMWELVARFEAQVTDDDDDYPHDTESYDGEPVYDGEW